KGNRHLHAGREGVSIVKGNSYIDGKSVGIKELLSAVEVTAASYEITAAGYGFYCW
nr:hypothetical protein [Tanacetum cinerariifolium]